MSTTIDNKVVEMRFDNKQFESNVSTTLSTLDKLKQKLNLSGASKGLENLSSVAKKTDLSGLTSGINTVNAKFSAMQIAGVTALANITNQAVNAGKRIVSALTIDPVKTGFSEYELKMGSIQTIMASSGASLETVNRYLNELNTYADKTIYSFSDMTTNIGKFTNAGVKLDDAVLAIKGISNEAAVSGANANEASRAMYNLAQALSAGYVKLIDWKSIELANMGTVEFKDQLLQAAEAIGTVTKVGDGLYQTLEGNTLSATRNFNETLQDQWLTTEVLISTLKDYADETTEIGKKAYAAAQDVKTATQLFDTLKEAAQSGWAETWEIIVGDFGEAKSLFTYLSEIFGDVIGKSADARNSMLRNVLGTSPWKKLSEVVENAGVSVDDFQEALKETARAHGIAVDDMISEAGSFESSLKNGWLSSEIILETMKSFTSGSEEMVASTENMAEKLEYFQKVVDEVWYGSWGNGQDRIEALTEAGYDYAKVQELVNKTVDGHRLTLEDLGEEQLQAIGYTEEEITALKALAEEAEKTGTPLNELIENMDEMSRREKLFETLKNIFEEIGKVLDTFKGAWKEVFPDSSVANGLGGFIDSIYDLAGTGDIAVETLESMRQAFKGVADAVWIVSALGGGVVGVIKKVLTAISYVLGFGDVWQLLGHIGGYISQFKSWITTNNELSQSLIAVGEQIIAFVDSTVLSILEWIANFAQLPAVTEGIAKIGEAFANTAPGVIEFLTTIGTAIQTFFTDIASGDFSFDGIKTAFDNLVSSITSGASSFGDVLWSFASAIGNFAKTILTELGIAEETIDNFVNAFSSWDNFIAALTNLGEQIRGFFDGIDTGGVADGILDGLVNGLQNGAAKVWGIMTDIGSKIIEAICAVLGIHSPSTEMFEVGKNAILGLINGLKELIPDIWDALLTIAHNILDFFKNLDFGTVFMVGMGAGLLYVFSKIAKALEIISGPFEGVKNVLDAVSDVVKSFGKTLKAANLLLVAGSVLSLALAIGVLVAAIVVLSKLDVDVGKMWMAVGVIAVLAIIIGGLAVALNKFGGVASVDAAKMSGILLSIGIALLAFAGVIYIISGIEWDGLGKAGAALVGLAVVVGVLIAVTSKFPDGDLNAAAKFAVKIGIAFLLIGAAIRIIAGVSWEGLGKAGAALLGFGVVVGALIAITHWAKGLERAVVMIGQIGLAFLLMAAAMRLIGGMDEGEITKAREAIVGFGLVIVALMMATQLLGGKAKSIASVGTMILSIAGAILLMTFAMKLLAGMNEGELQSAIDGLGVIAIVVTLFMIVISLIEKVARNIDKAAVTLMGMAVAVAILAGVAVLLGMIDPNGLIKGIVAVGFLVAMVSLMALAAGKAKEVKGTMIAMAVCVGILAAAVIALSFIDPERIKPAMEAMAVVLAVFALAIYATKYAKKAIGTLVVMTVAIGLIAGAIFLLSNVPADRALASAVSISIVLLALSASLVIAGKAGTISKKALPGLVVLGVAILIIAGALKILENANGLNSIGNAVAIAVVMAALSASLIIASKAGSLAKGALPAIAVMSVVILILSVSLRILNGVDWAGSIGNAVALGILVGIISVALLVLSRVGPAAIAGAAALAIISVGLIAISAALYILKDVPFEQIMAGVLGLIIVIAGLTAAAVILNFFAAGAAALSGVLLTASIFVLALSAAFLIFSAALVVVGIALPMIGEGLTALGLGIQNFVTQVAGANGLVDEFAAVMTTVGFSILACLALIAGGMLIAAAGAVTLGAGSIVLGAGLLVAAAGLLAVSLGITALGVSIFVLCAAVTAGIQLIVAGMTNMVSFAQTAGGDLVLGFANGIVNAIGSVIAAAAGFVQSIGSTICGLLGIHSPSTVAAEWGQNTGEGYAQGLTASSESGATAATGFIDTIKGILSGDVSFEEAMGNKGTEGANNFGTGLSEGMSGIDFSSMLGETGIDMSAFQTAMNTEGGEGATSFGTGLTEGMAGYDFSSIFGETGIDMSAFQTMMNTEGGEGATSFGTGLTEGMAGYDFSSIFGETGIDMSAFQTMMNTEGGEGATSFGTGLSEGMGSLDISGALNGVSVDGSQIQANMHDQGVQAANSFGTGLSEGLSSLAISVDSVATSVDTSAFNTAGASAVTAFSEGISSSTDAAVAVMNSPLLSSLPDAIVAYSGTINSAAASMASGAANAARAASAGFFSAGLYAASGFASGISSGSFAASVRARSMALAAVAAAKAALKINSPSKVFIQMGRYVSEGFAKGIDKFGYFVQNSTDSMANTALAGTQKAISQISDIVDNDIDAEPTIRPVLDLSNVKSGVRAIGGLFDGSPSVGVLGRINAVNAMMNRRRQNGVNDDVVSAINDLRKDVGNLENRSYNLGGVTYSAGDEVADAIETIVRYANIERRI